MRDGTKRNLARQLRRTMTDAEQLLWRHLRRQQIVGCRFRRQHPFGPYVLDFVCLERRLVIEVDGGQHVASAHDQHRDEWLARHSFTTLRFWNDEVLTRTDDVLNMIIAALGSLTDVESEAPSMIAAPPRAQA